MNYLGRVLFIFFLFVVSGIDVLAQKEYKLGAFDCAIVIFHISDTCPCSSYSDIDIFDSVYTKKIYPCQIDSVVVIHAVNDYLDTSWFSGVRYIITDDSVMLQMNKQYIGSINVGFDMDYIELHVLLDTNTKIIDLNDGHPRPSAFLCVKLSDVAVLKWMRIHDKDEDYEEFIKRCEKLKELMMERLSRCRDKK